MPKDAAGNFRMNAQIARSPVGAKKSAAPAAYPNTDPNADPNQAQGQEESVTITRKADGTYSYSDSKGQEQDVPDFQSAMAQAQQCFGESGDGDKDDQGAPALDQQSSGGSGNDVMGY